MSRLISRAPADAISAPRAVRPALCLAALWVLFICAAPPAARAQDLDDVTISGTVADEHGALVTGAAVTAVPSATKAGRSVVTNDEGRYRLVELPPGEYTLRVSREGFAAEERAGVSALAGRSLRLDFVLRAGGPAAEEAVVSESGAAAVDTTRVAAGGAVTREELERLPSASRSALDSVFTLGGVAEEPLRELYF